MAITDRMMKSCDLSAWRGSALHCRWCNKKLTGKQKRWCSPHCGNAASTHHWFSWARKVVVRNGRYDGCVKCGSHERLEVNHITPCLGLHSKASCKHHVTELELVCRKCHLEITREQRESGRLSKAKKV